MKKVRLPIKLMIFIITILCFCSFIKKTLATEENNSIEAYSIEQTGLPTSGNLANNTMYTLNKNVQLTGELVIPAGYTVAINLNGYAIFAADGNRAITNRGTLTIKDEASTNQIHYGSLGSIERMINRNNRKELYNPNGYSDGKVWEMETVDNIIWDYEGTVTNASQVPSDKISVEGGIITGGYASLGAAIYNQGGKLYLEGGTLIGNQAHRTESGFSNSGHGGAVYNIIYNNNIAQFTMTGGAILYNCGDGSGGGVRVRSGTFYMKSGIIGYNDTTASGGGVNVQGSTTERPEFIFGADLTETDWQNKYEKNPESIPVINNNTTKDTRNTGNGGGIHVENADITYNAGEIKYNQSTGSGGGIYAYIGANVQAQSEYCVIEYNNAGGSGGGIMQQYGEISLQGSVIRNNIATAGGGINVRVGNFTMSNGIVSDNTARTSNGGGICASAQNNISPHYDEGNLGCNVTISGGTFSGNEALKGNGGAIYISVRNSTEECNVDIIGGEILANYASNNGGGIFLEGGNLTISEDANLKTNISNNTAGNLGGAAYIANMVSTTCYEKDAEKYATKSETDTNPVGYSEYFTKTTPGYVELSGGEFFNNYATKSGGSIYINNGDMVMTGGDFSENVAEEHGGALYIKGGTLQMSEGSFEKNQSTQTGGAVCVNGGEVNISGGNISYNNSADGGAVYISNGNFLITSGEVTNNTASQEGGAVYVNGGSIVIGIEGCTIENSKHEAPNTHPNVTGNIAVYGGGGFMTDGTMTMYCGVLINNSSNNAGTGDNVYMNGGTFELAGGSVGEETNPGIVLVGGELKDTRVEETEENKITMVYHSCLDSGVEHRVSVTPGKYVNVPAAQTGWVKEGYTMVGWTTIENAEVRAFEDYKSVGMAVKVDNPDVNKEIHYYAVWAKTTSTITYNLDGGTVTGTNVTSYNYSVILKNIQLISPVKQYYKFIGWRLTASEETKTNWETYYPEGEKSVFYSVEDPESSLDLNIGTHFGDITLTAVYEIIVKDIQININNSAVKNQSYILNITGTPNTASEFKTLKIATITDENGCSSVIIKDIPIGTYTIELEGKWSWRYGLSENNIQSATNLEIDESQEIYNVNFEEFDIKNQSWLNSYKYVKK